MNICSAVFILGHWDGYIPNVEADIRSPKGKVSRACDLQLGVADYLGSTSRNRYIPVAGAGGLYSSLWGCAVS